MIGLAYLSVSYAGREGTEQVQGGWVTPDAFGVLGSRPLLGRPLTSEDGKPGSPPVFVMSYQPGCNAAACAGPGQRVRVSGTSRSRCLAETRGGSGTS
jgi:hypothetical protein